MRIPAGAVSGFGNSLGFQGEVPLSSQLLETDQSVGPWLSQNLHFDGMAAFTAVRFVHGSEAASSQSAAGLEAVRKSDLDREGERREQIGIGGGGVDSQAEVSSGFRVVRPQLVAGAGLVPPDCGGTSCTEGLQAGALAGSPRLDLVQPLPHGKLEATGCCIRLLDPGDYTLQYRLGFVWVDGNASDVTHPPRGDRYQSPRPRPSFSGHALAIVNPTRGITACAGPSLASAATFQLPANSGSIFAARL